MKIDYRKFTAELVGTFVLVFGGCGSAVFAGPHIGYAGVALAFGLSLLVMVYAIGNISGCHINPAVSLGMFIAGKIRLNELLYYCVAQIAGGVLAGGLIYLICTGMFGFNIASGFAANGFGQHSPAGYNLLSCFLAESVLTAVFLFVIMATTHPKFPAGFNGVAIGLVLVLIHLISIPITNTSVNPARSIGVAVYQGGWALEQLWLFAVAPCVGAIVGVLLYKIIGEAKR